MTAGRGALADTKSYNHMPVLPTRRTHPRYYILCQCPMGAAESVHGARWLKGHGKRTSSSSSSLSLTGMRKGNTAGHNHIVI
jgi:hypothetical protein